MYIPHVVENILRIVEKPLHNFVYFWMKNAIHFPQRTKFKLFYTWNNLIKFEEALNFSKCDNLELVLSKPYFNEFLFALNWLWPNLIMFEAGFKFHWARKIAFLRSEQVCNCHKQARICYYKFVLEFITNFQGYWK